MAKPMAGVPDLKNFVAATEAAERLLYAEEVSWKTKHEIVFGATMQNSIKMTGVKPEYESWDDGYEQEVRRYVQALTEKAVEVRAAIRALEGSDA